MNRTGIPEGVPSPLHPIEKIDKRGGGGGGIISVMVVTALPRNEMVEV